MLTIYRMNGVNLPSEYDTQWNPLIFVGRWTQHLTFIMPSRNDIVLMTPPNALKNVSILPLKPSSQVEHSVALSSFARLSNAVVCTTQAHWAPAQAVASIVPRPIKVEKAPSLIFRQGPIITVPSLLVLSFLRLRLNRCCNRTLLMHFFHNADAGQLQEFRRGI